MIYASLALPATVTLWLCTYCEATTNQCFDEQPPHRCYKCHRRSLTRMRPRDMRGVDTHGR